FTGAFSAFVELSGQEGPKAPEVESFGASLTQLTEKLRPSVVLIESYGRKRRQDALRRDLFRDPEMGALGAKAEVGAGVIISPDGLILTHQIIVPFEKQQIFVTTSQGRFEARLLVFDGTVDAALLNIVDPKGRKWTAAKWNETPAKPTLGAFLLSYGNAFGTARDGVPGVSLGHISGYGEVPAKAALFKGPVILTDASINPGCYGGPAFDRHGRLLGINAPLRKGLRSGALLRVVQPIAPMMKRLKKQLAQSKPYLGVLVGQGNALDGLEVVLVKVASPADKAGVKAGDRIRQINSKEIATRDDLAKLLQKKEPGDKLTVTLRRGKEVKIVEIELGQKK
ncbi:MAG: PDZ domain-containing protein, partial [Planctomycetota bacterium]|nr:PDZ domain-containing protein [Planctomycetota bacterium]